MEEKRYAILVGINDYKNNTILSYSSNDVENIESILIDYCNFDRTCIKPLISTEDKHLSIGLKEIITERDEIKKDFVPENDVIFFYFSGHGGIADNEFNLDFDSEKIPLGQIFNELKKLAPKFLIMMVDSCHSGKLFEFKGVEEISIEEYFEKRYHPNLEGFYLLASSAEKEKSKAYHSDKMGLYTKHLIKEIVDKKNYRENVLPLENAHALVRLLLERDKLQIPHMQITGGGFIISNIEWHPVEQENIPEVLVPFKEFQDVEDTTSFTFFKNLCTEVHDILSPYDSIVIGTIFNDYNEAGITFNWYNNQEYAAEAIADRILDEDGVDWQSNVKMRALWKDLNWIKSFEENENDSFWEQFYQTYPKLDWDFGIKTFWESVFDIQIRFR